VHNLIFLFLLFTSKPADLIQVIIISHSDKTYSVQSVIDCHFKIFSDRKDVVPVKRHVKAQMLRSKFFSFGLSFKLLQKCPNRSSKSVFVLLSFVSSTVYMRYPV